MILAKTMMTSCRRLSGRAPLLALLPLAFLLLACANSPPPTQQPPTSVHVASEAPPFASDAPPTPTASPVASHDEVEEVSAWPSDGVALDDGRLTLAQARGVARAIRQHFDEPSTVAHFGGELASLCGDVQEPFMAEQDLARLGPWLMTEVTTAICTYDLGHGSGVRKWIEVTLAHDEHGAPHVTASAYGHAHRR